VRFMAKVTIPSEKWDEAQGSGTLQSTIDSALQRLRPESAYFFDEEGKREWILVFNLDVAAMLKPLFPNLDASIEGRPVTTAAEFQQQSGGTGVKRPTETPDLLDDIRPAAAARVPATHETPPEAEHEPSDPEEQTSRMKPDAESAGKPR